MSEKKPELSDKEKAINMLNVGIKTIKKELSQNQQNILKLQENKKTLIYIKKIIQKMK